MLIQHPPVHPEQRTPWQNNTSTSAEPGLMIGAGQLLAGVHVHDHSQFLGDKLLALDDHLKYFLEWGT